MRLCAAAFWCWRCSPASKYPPSTRRFSASVRRNASAISTKAAATWRDATTQIFGNGQRVKSTRRWRSLRSRIRLMSSPSAITSSKSSRSWRYWEFEILVCQQLEWWEKNTRKILILNLSTTYIRFGDFLTLSRFFFLTPAWRSPINSHATYTHLQHTFWGVSSLRILDLERNNITHINSENFKGQQQLHELNLSRNRLGAARIPSGTFEYLRVSLSSAEKLTAEYIIRPMSWLSALSFSFSLKYIAESDFTKAGSEHDRRAHPANLSELKESPISRPKWQSTWESSARCFSRYSGKSGVEKRWNFPLYESLVYRVGAAGCARLVEAAKRPRRVVKFESHFTNSNFIIYCRPPQAENELWLNLKLSFIDFDVITRSYILTFDAYIFGILYHRNWKPSNADTAP